MNESRPVVLLGGLANSLSVARSLGARGVPIHYIGDRWANVRFSRYLTSFVALEPGPANRYMAPLRRSGLVGAVVIPCGDDGLEFVARNRQELASLGFIAIDAQDDMLLAMLDKEKTYEIARRAGIPAPATVHIEDPGMLPDAISRIGLPAALKPRVSHDYARHFAGKAVVAENVSQAEASYREISSRGIDLLMTEIIPGPEGTYWGYYAYIDESGSRLLEFTKRKLRQFPLGFGLGTLHRMEPNDSVLQVGRRFVEAAGLRGLVNVEFKQDDRDGSYVLIECNHRITAANELMRSSGIDLAHFVYARLVGEACSCVEERRAGVALWWPFRDTIAALAQMRAGELGFAQWLDGLRGRIVFPFFTLSDPLPVFASVVRSMSRAGIRLRRLFALAHR